VSFCADGHTIAVGASNSGAILVYDLRKSSKEVYKLCSGHTQTINSLNFANKVPSTKKKAEETVSGAKAHEKGSNHRGVEEQKREFKSMD